MTFQLIFQSFLQLCHEQNIIDFLEWRHQIQTETVEVIGSVTNAQTMLILLKPGCLGVIPGLQAKSSRSSCVCISDEPFCIHYCYIGLCLTKVSSGFPVVYPWLQGKAVALENDSCFTGFKK